MIKIKKVVVLNDLRAVPVIAALKIARNSSDSILVASRRMFYNHEYADYTPLIWKLLVLFVLKFCFNIKIIEKDKNTDLTNSEILGLISSLYSITNDSGSTQIKYPKIFAQLRELSLGAKEVLKYISSLDASIVYLFNGRTASSYLISKYCHKCGLYIYYYEYAKHCNGYRLFPVPPHASGDIGKIIFKFRQQAIIAIPELKKNAMFFKEEKLNNDFAINNSQKSNKEYDVSVYLGSDYEYTAVDPEVCNIEWNGNIDFCKKVISKYGNDKTYAIRCHPNSYNDKNWPALFDDLKKFVISSNVDIDLLGPDSKIDSHDLMRKSKVVVTELSSIAVDAALMCLNVDIFGNTDLKFILKQLNGKRNWTPEQKSMYIAEIFSLWPNFLVIRFNRKEKIACTMLFYVHRSFEKIKQCYQ